MLRKTFNYVALPRKLAWVFKSKEEKYEKRGLICSHLNTLCLFYEKSIKCSICEKKFSSLTLILKSIGFGFGIGLRPIVSQAYCSVQAYCEKCSFGHSLMIILHGDTIEQLTFILSEFRAALAVTNPGRGSRQPHTEQL